MVSILAQATEVTTQDISSNTGNLIFMGCFFLVLIVIGIWWLKRQS